MIEPQPSPVQPASGPGGAHSFRQGRFLVTVVTDGFISVPPAVMTAGADPIAREAIIGRLPKGVDGVRAEANIPVVRTGDDIIVFDVGGGGRYQPTEGRFVENLREAGIAPSDVTKVVVTHAHPDHVWGIRGRDGGTLFPNATTYIGRAEWEFWMDPDFETTMPAGLCEFAYGTREALSAIEDRVSFLQPGEDVTPGLRGLGTPGHTPGHLSFELAGGDGLLIAADVATSIIVSFEHPDWVFGFDTLPEIAIKTRQRFLDRAATDRHKLLGYHWPYPGVGYAARAASGYRYIPSP